MRWLIVPLISILGCFRSALHPHRSGGVLCTPPQARPPSSKTGVEITQFWVIRATFAVGKVLHFVEITIGRTLRSYRSFYALRASRALGHTGAPLSRDLAFTVAIRCAVSRYACARAVWGDKNMLHNIKKSAFFLCLLMSLARYLYVYI